jgi:iron(III) transport system permease protein
MRETGNLPDRAGGLALILGLVVLLVWPLLAIIIEASRGTSTPTGAGLIDAAMTADVGRPLGLALTTLRVTLGAALIAVPLGTTLALLVFRTDLFGRAGLVALMGLGLFVPMPLHATAWLGAIGNAGRTQAVGSAPLLLGASGAAFIHAMAALPWVVLLVGVGLRSIPGELEETALLEMPAWRIAWSVTLRGSLGAIAAATLAVAFLTAGDMTVTDLLQVRTYAEEVFVQSQLGKGPATAAKVAIPPLLAIGGLILAGCGRLIRSDPTRPASTRQRPRTWRLGAWRLPLGMALGSLVGGLLAVPLYGLIWRAGRVAGKAAGGLAPHWSPRGLAGTLVRAWPDVAEPSALAYQPLRSPLLNTALWAGVAATLTVAIGWGLAWKARRPGPWASVAALVVALTLAAPGPVVGLALKLAYLRLPLVHDTGLIVVLAYAARTLPYAIIVLWPALRLIPPEFLDAALVDGYGPWGRLQRVALPLSRGATMAAWAVAFVLALGELPASNLVLPPGLMTISARVWMLLHTGVESHLAGVGLILLAVYGTIGWAAWRLMAHDASPLPHIED